MTLNHRTAFFDAIADQWDGWEDLPALEKKLADGLEELGVRADKSSGPSAKPSRRCA